MKDSRLDSHVPDPLDSAASHAGSNRFERGLSLTVLAMCSGYYIWLALPENVLSPVTANPTSYYHHLSEGFLQGQLSLPIPPHPELLKLPNPYDPQANLAYRLHDASLYNGKYYLYFGPTPALTIFIPVRIISGLYLYESFAIAIFLIAGVSCWLALFHRVVRSILRPIGPVLLFFAVLSLALCTTGPFLLARPLAYEVALSSGYCFSAAFILFGYLAVSDGTSRPRLLLVSSLALGLAIGARPTYVLLIPVSILAAWKLSAQGGMEGWRRLRTIITYTLPLSVSLLLLAVYNYLRFNSPFEFGTSYQLLGLDTSQLSLFSAKRMLSGVWYYMVEPFHLMAAFPFISLQPVPRAFLPQGQILEPVAGALCLYPVLAMLLLWPFLRRRRPAFAPNDTLMVATVAVGVGLLALLSCFLGATMRYGIEFTPWLIFGALVTGGHWTAAGDEGIGRVAKRFVVCALAAYGVLTSLLLGCSGYHGTFRSIHPSAYAALQRRTSFIERYLSGAANYGGVLMRVELPTGTRGENQVLLTTGRNLAGNWMLMQYQERDIVRFGCDMWGQYYLLGDPVQIRPGEEAVLELQMTPLYPASPTLFHTLFPSSSYDAIGNRCFVRMDGKIVTDIRTPGFHPSSGSQIVIGRNPLDAYTEAKFRGKILGVERIGPPK